jgi:hypothetical protein
MRLVGEWPMPAGGHVTCRKPDVKDRKGATWMLGFPVMTLSRSKTPDRDVAHARERRSQLRGLLWLALAVLLWILYRVDRQNLFHAGWWRP